MPRALIIESDAAVAKSLVALLARKKVQAQVTADGTEGVNLARTFEPDVIVLCVELSRVSGYSICNKLKKDPDLGRIPLVLTSSQATEETFDQHKKLKTRAEAYLKKPYTDAEILEIVSPYISGKAAGPAAPEIDVGLDELSVDVEDAPLTPAGGGSFDLDLDLDTGLEEPARKRERGAATAGRASARPTAASTPAPEPTTPATRPAVASSASEGQTEQLRAENRQLRQKMQKLEETLEQKELEFNDRLLQESSRGREGLEAKKRLTALERELAKYKDIFEKSQGELAAARQELADLRGNAQTGESERHTLMTKMGQLVDKVKSLAAERDSLQRQVDELLQVQSGVREESESATKVREKARKAVDIALQLIDETGLVH